MELLIVAPVLLLMIFGAIEFGVVYNEKTSLNDASRNVARDVSTSNPSGCTQDDFGPWFDCIAAASTDVRPIAVSVEFENNDAEPGDYFTVCLEHPVDGVTPIAGGFVDGRNLVSRTRMRLEKTPFFDTVGDESFEDGYTGGESPEECT